MQFSGDELKKLIDLIACPKAKEVSCRDCLEQLAEFAESQLAGKTVEEARAAIRQHIDRCDHCAEEYMALLEALETLEEPRE